MDEPQAEILPPKKNKGGRPKGSVNKLTKDRRDYLKALFEKPKAREHIRKLIEDGLYNNEPKLAALVIHLHSMAYGKPVPQAPAVDNRSPLLFVTQHNIGSYDPLAEKAAALAARKAERALPERTAEAEKFEPPKSGDPEGLVVVEPGALAAQALPRKP